MSIPGSASPLFFQTAAADAAAAGPIKSVRFNDDSQSHLSKTLSSSGNRRTYTISLWTKRGNLGKSYQPFLSNPDSNGYNGIYFDFSSDYLHIGEITNGWAWIWQSAAQYRDTSAWYHIVAAIDTTQAVAANRIKMYVNGVQVTDFYPGYPTYPSQNFDTNFNNNTLHAIGQLGSVAASAYNYDGYMADFYFIDGQQLDPTSFGAFDSSGVWQAAAYSGTFGTNGFHLFDFANESGIGNDSSGNDNDFTVNNLVDDQITLPEWWTTDTLYTTKADVIANGTNRGQNGFTLSSDNYVYLIPNNGGTAGAKVHATGSSYPSGFYVFGRSSGDSTWTYKGGYGASEAASFTWNHTDSSTDYSIYKYSSATDIFLIGDTRSGSPPYQPVSDTKLSGTFPALTNTSGGVPSADTDVLRDVPTNGDSSDDTGEGGEVSGCYATFNLLNNTTTYTFSNGNLEATGYGSNRQMTSTIGVSSGKWYAEFTITGSGGSTNTIVGVSGDTDSRFDYYPGQGQNAYGYAAGDGKLYNNGAGATYGATWTYGDVIGVALDLDNGTLTFYKNNSTQGQAATGLSGTYFFAARNSSTSGDKLIANWGQRAFTYTAPSGYKALCTTNLPTPTIADGSDYFEAKTFTSNNSSQSITLGLSPDLVWTKSRSVSYEGQIFDAVRGDNQELSPNATRADRTLANSLTFDSSGFTMGTNNNANYGTGGSSIAWAWDAGSSTVSNTDGDITSSVRANQTAGFSIVSYTGTGSSATVGHGLNVAPEMIIIKRRSASASWIVGHQHIALSDPWDYLLNLDGTNDLFDAFAIWTDTAPTNSVFSIGTSTSVNANTDTYIAYCFAPVAGYSAFGRYQGNGVSDGVFVYTGFRPAFVMVRRVTSDLSNWGIFDSSRDASNVAKTRLYANSSSAESTSTDFADLLSNGFKFRSDNYNWNGSSSNRYIYYAVAENPFQANGGLAR